MYVYFVYIWLYICKKYKIFKPLNIVVGKRNNIYSKTNYYFFYFRPLVFFAYCEGHVMRPIYFYKNVKTFYSVFRILLNHYKELLSKK